MAEGTENKCNSIELGVLIPVGKCTPLLKSGLHAPSKIVQRPRLIHIRRDALMVEYFSKTVGKVVDESDHVDGAAMRLVGAQWPHLDHTRHTAAGICLEGSWQGC